MINDRDARETTRGDELLTGGTGNTNVNRELHDKLKAAFIAGYLERELAVRESDRTTQQIAERKAKRWIEQRGWRE